MEQFIVIVLLFSLLAVFLYSMYIFLWLLYDGMVDNIMQEVSVEKNILLSLHTIFGGFMLVLIGIELLRAMKIYLKENLVHAEVVILVAIIGLSRHIIDLKLDKDPLYFAGLGILIVCIVGSYYLIRESSKKKTINNVD
ncbi:MAG: phosphate-starvation-inducible PsiE family protein [Psychroserpens sp.]|uniref:phosphate-starvation-inducible PsiE family protein n=1 Tax=Psychroserpens sp. TaxID=2020870 RepID=UPI003CBA8739